MNTEQLHSSDKVIKVTFFVPVNGQTDYYFGSLKAIYSVFTKEEIGCSLGALYPCHITPGNPKATSKCVISKHQIIRKKHEKHDND